MVPHSPVKGALFLLLASALWGCAFVPQALSVANMGPWWGTALRFCLAAPAACLLAGRSLRAPGAGASTIVLLGALLYLAFYFQTAAVKLTPVWRVSLLTGTYAIFTPLLAPWFGHARPSALHWAGAGLAVGGLALLVGVGLDAGPADAPLRVPFNLGDLMTLGHALLTAVHILLIGRLAATARPLALNALQLVVMAACALPAAALLEDGPSLTAFDPKTTLSFVYLAVFSSTVAFGAQIAGQRTASPPAAAVIMLLEAPIGAVTALLLLNEAMAPGQAAGAVLLLSGVAASVFADVRRTRSRQAQRPQPT